MTERRAREEEAAPSSDTARSNAYLIWETLSDAERLGYILRDSNSAAWLQDTYQLVLMHFRPVPEIWAMVIDKWQGLHRRPRDLEAAVDARLLKYAASHNGTTAHRLPPPETLTHLIAGHIPPPKQLFAGLMHEGMLLFGGKSKRGKSWLIFDLAIALAVGRAGFRHFRLSCTHARLISGAGRWPCQAYKVEPKPFSRTSRRANNFHLRYSFPPLAHGGIEALHAEISCYHYGLVIIDVLAKLETSAAGKSERGYHDVYDMFTPSAGAAQTASLLPGHADPPSQARSG